MSERSDAHRMAVDMVHEDWGWLQYPTVAKNYPGRFSRAAGWLLVAYAAWKRR